MNTSCCTSRTGSTEGSPSSLRAAGAALPLRQPSTEPLTARMHVSTAGELPLSGSPSASLRSAFVDSMANSAPSPSSATAKTTASFIRSSLSSQLSGRPCASCRRLGARASVLSNSAPVHRVS